MTIAPCTDDGHNAPSWLRITSPKCGARCEWQKMPDDVLEARKAARDQENAVKRAATKAKHDTEAFERRRIFSETVARERVARHEYSLRMRAEKASENKRRHVVAAVRKSRAKPQDQRSGYRIAERMREEIERRRPAGMLTKIEAVTYMRNNYGRGSLSGLHKAIMEKRLVAIKIDRYYYMTTTAIDDYRKRSHEAHVKTAINFNRARAAKHKGEA